MWIRSCHSNSALHKRWLSRLNKDGPAPDLNDLYFANHLGRPLSVDWFSYPFKPETRINVLESLVLYNCAVHTLLRPVLPEAK